MQWMALRLGVTAMIAAPAIAGSQPAHSYHNLSEPSHSVVTDYEV